MMAAQWPQDLTDSGRDWNSDVLAAFAVLADRARAPINLRPAQKTFVQPQAASARESEEREQVGPRCRFKFCRLIIRKFAHPLGGDGQHVLAPMRLVQEARTPQLGAGEQRA
jgi:hypothetical protein